MTCILASAQVQAQCPNGTTELKVSILTDNYPQETTWQVTNSSGAVLMSGGPFADQATVYMDSVCIPTDACVEFRIIDSYGDGICCGFGQGSYTVYLDEAQVGTGGQFTSQDFQLFNCPPGSSCSNSVPIGEGTFTTDFNNQWYTFVPAQNGNYEISTCQQGNNCNTKLWVYDHCNNLVWDNTNAATIYYDDNAGGCGETAIIPAALLEGGVTYYVRVASIVSDCGPNINFSITYNGPIVGCMDPTACNYNPLASVSSDDCIFPGDPNCPDGPDLIVVQSAIETSMYLSTQNVPGNDCYVAEGCMNGYGMRDIIRFTTHIKNIGNLDYYIGSPSANPGQFDFVNCHNHVHYKGYAEYLLYDLAGNEIPIGFKNGFCVMDLECSGGGTAQYGCSTMGITAGCGDIYSSGLSCQWIDITDVDTGTYTMVVRTNWDQSPDALGRLELSHTNNWAQVCIYLGRDDNGVLFVEQVPDCPLFVDCTGEVFGNAQLDCLGECGGIALRGDLDENNTQNGLDAQAYVSHILADDIPTTLCNDLNADGEIDVYDATLLVDCSLFINDAHTTGSPHDHCSFPYGITNIFDTVELSIGAVNFNENYFDVYIRNPDNFVVAYQFDLEGVEITSVENLIDPTWYPITPQAQVGGGRVIGISYQDSLIDKYMVPTPLCRVHYFQLTDTAVCISSIKAVVNQYYEETMTEVVDGCFSYHVGVDEQEFGVTMRTFPNPFSQTTTIELGNRYGRNLSIRIADPTGRIVRDLGNISTDRVVIDRTGMASGMYLAQVWDGTRLMMSEKLMVD